jgi:hypothetical protein
MSLLQQDKESALHAHKEQVQVLVIQYVSSVQVILCNNQVQSLSVTTALVTQQGRPASKYSDSVTVITGSTNRKYSDYSVY